MISIKRRLTKMKKFGGAFSDLGKKAESITLLADVMISVYERSGKLS